MLDHVPHVEVVELRPGGRCEKELPDVVLLHVVLDHRGEEVDDGPGHLETSIEAECRPHRGELPRPGEAERDLPVDDLHRDRIDLLVIVLWSAVACYVSELLHTSS